MKKAAHRAALLLTALMMAIGVTAAFSAPATATDTSTGTAAAGVPEASTSSTTAPTSARSAARRYYWGAIAISDGDYGWGTSYDYRTKRAARKAAMRRCRHHSNYPGKCVVRMVVLNQCGAYAWKRRANGSLHWGYARYHSKAKTLRKARARAGKGSKLLTWVCTTR